MKDTFRLCRKCGKPIGVISTGLYRNILVDAEAVDVKADPFGDVFVRVDGTKMRGSEINPKDFIEYVVTGRPGKETAYRPHRCGGKDDL